MDFLMSDNGATHATYISELSERTMCNNVVTFLLGLTLVLGSIFLANSALAQSTDAVTEAEQEQIAKSIVASTIPAEVISDFDVSGTDLNYVEATVLPNNPLHFFKRLGWGLQEAFTFNPIKDAQLKLQHSNQQLGEIRQLIDVKGIANVNAGNIASAINYFENKVQDLSRTADKLKDSQVNNSEAVDVLLNDITDKQLKQQQMLDTIGQEVIKVKIKIKDSGESGSNKIEKILEQVNETKSNTIANFTELLTIVDVQPQRVSARITAVMDAQGGSEFKPLKNLEILEAIGDSAPGTMRAAIDLAKQNTITKFEIRLAALPIAVRAQRFQDYIEHAPVDETRLLSLLDEIKLSSGIPDDLLAKIEEAKEIVVRKFEIKLRVIDDRDIKQQFFKNFDTNNVNDLIALEEFKNRMNADSDEFTIMEDAHARSLAAFKSNFNDTNSQAQAVLFQRLSEEMLNNPSPKTFRLLQELESEVRSDPTKGAFLDDLERDMTDQFDTRFRREGDKFLDRITTLDPHDIGIFEDFNFGGGFEDRFVVRNADKFKGFMQDVNNPEYFDRFHERFFDVPEFVINEIRGNDPGFQDAMQFKVRKMEELRAEQEREITRARLDFEERELYHQSDRLQRQEDDEFWNTLNDTSWDDFDTRKQLWDQKINDDYSRVDARFTEQQRIFEQRITNDPWCDSVCQQIQIQFLEQDLRHEQERLTDDLTRERNRIELERVQFERDNPLANICSTPDECDQYCSNNPGVPGCEWAHYEPVYLDCGPPPAYFDPGLGTCQYPDDDPGFIDCSEGQYYDGFSCVFDPYYRAPGDFRNCDPGFFWNDFLGYCEPEFFDCTVAYFVPRTCDPDEQPLPPTPGDFCGQPSCIIGTPTICPLVSPQQCPEGQYQEANYDHNGCQYFGECIGSEKNSCPTSYAPVCGSDNTTYSNDCFAKTAGVSISYYSECTNDDIQTCKSDSFYASEIDRCIPNNSYVPSTPSQCDNGWSWNFLGYCERDESDTGQCASTCQPACSGVSYCIYDNFGCADTCSPECGDEEYYDQNSGACIGVNLPGTNDNWVNHTWYFSDGSSENSYILNRTDSEYLNYITGVETKCKNISKAKFFWPSSAGDDSNWVTFGIPDCSAQPQLGVCPSDQVSCPDDSCAYSLAECYGDSCGDNTCGLSESADTCPVDCGTTTTTCNYNGTCESNESISSCSSDCHDNSSSYCGNYICDSGETTNSCPIDCGGNTTSCDYNSICDANEDTSCSDCTSACGGNTSSSSCTTQSNCCWYSDSSANYCYYSSSGCDIPETTSSYCGNGTCDSGEDASWCASDCSTSDGGYCGDGSCSGTEDSSSCSADCGGSGIACSSTIFNNYTTSNTCNYSNCPNGCQWDSNSCPISCDNPSTPPSYSGYCGDNVCDSNETSSSCPVDCGSGTTSSCTGNSYNDYNTSYSYSCSYSTCSNGCEFDSSGCATSCIASTSYCGDGTCDPGEDNNYCPVDCSS